MRYQLRMNRETGERTLFVSYGNDQAALTINAGDFSFAAYELEPMRRVKRLAKLERIRASVPVLSPVTYTQNQEDSNVPL